MAIKEQKFFNWFLVCTGILVGTIVSIIIFGNFIGTESDEQSHQETLNRLASMTAVVIEGEPEPTISHEPEASELVMAGVQSGEAIYNSVCSVCHSIGLAGAPTTSDESWAARLAQGPDIIQQHVLNGYQGVLAIMPAKGGRTDLSDNEIISALDHMLDLI